MDFKGKIAVLRHLEGFLVVKKVDPAIVPYISPKCGLCHFLWQLNTMHNNWLVTHNRKDLNNKEKMWYLPLELN